MSRRSTRGGDLPLIQWGEDLRRRRRSARRRVVVAGCIGPLIGLVASTIAYPPPPCLVWNATASAPIGLYAVTPGGVATRGAMVIARVPASIRPLAAERRYIPINVPLVKHVGAVPGDTICAIGNRIMLDGRTVAIRRAADPMHRPMPWWNGCHLLRQGEIFLLSPNISRSFDGRYFGVSSSADIIGTARPIWVR